MQTVNGVFKQPLLFSNKILFKIAQMFFLSGYFRSHIVGCRDDADQNFSWRTIRRNFV